MYVSSRGPGLSKSSAEPPPRYSMMIHSLVLWDRRQTHQHLAARGRACSRVGVRPESARAQAPPVPSLPRTLNRKGLPRPCPAPLLLQMLRGRIEYTEQWLSLLHQDPVKNQAAEPVLQGWEEGMAGKHMAQHTRHPPGQDGHSVPYTPDPGTTRNLLLTGPHHCQQGCPHCITTGRRVGPNGHSEPNDPRGSCSHPACPGQFPGGHALNCQGHLVPSSMSLSPSDMEERAGHSTSRAAASPQQAPLGRSQSSG